MTSSVLNLLLRVVISSLAFDVWIFQDLLNQCHIISDCSAFLHLVFQLTLGERLSTTAVEPKKSKATTKSRRLFSDIEFSF